MKLIVGLGNPGKEYENTRHNVGFMVLDDFAKNHSFTFKNKNNGEYAEYTINNEKVIFLKPLSFMNLSGEVVKKYIDYFNIDISDVFVIYDDINFDLGKFKLKKEGSSGGHNGINNIIKILKTEEIKRLKIGISKNNKKLVNYVTGKFGILEKNKIREVIKISNEIIEDFIMLDYDKLMNKYNGINNEN